jgi:hypothetical protein
MRYFHWSVKTFESTSNPPNAGLAVMDRQSHYRRSFSLTLPTWQMLKLPMQSYRSKIEEPAV